MIRRPPRSTQSRSSAASDVYKRQVHGQGLDIAGGSDGFKPYKFETLAEICSKLSDENPTVWGDVRCRIVNVTHLRDTPLYFAACPQCNRKATNEGRVWKCNYCNRYLEKEPEQRYRLPVSLVDSTGEVQAILFDPGATTLVGFSATEFARRDRERPDAPLIALREKLRGRDVFLRIKFAIETLDIETKIRVSVFRAQIMSYADVNRLLLNQLTELMES
eukprot:TRINITY_DN15017_c0_g1_i3.p1 TRINITY_DN15017_c0_g1~~TRINITY_DN15017_c0_g1_i3.p1  ORF type:complete len:219 (+),score=38.35 TRINITY_DN15017_c0_g1_i3:72-728(+)